MAEEIIYVSEENLSELASKLTDKYKEDIFATKSQAGSPTPITNPTDFDTIASSGDKTRTYVYLGLTSSGYIYGHLYYWQNDGWVDGGLVIAPNPTLTVNDKILSSINIYGTNYRIKEKEVVTVSDIKAIPSRYIGNLSTGDSVIESQNITSRTLYTVSYTAPLERRLINITPSQITYIYYFRSTDDWHYSRTTVFRAIDKQDTLVSGTNIKTINGNSILGEGNLAINTYQPFPNTWITNSTTIAFCSDVNADTSAVEGMAYLGELYCSDLPFNGNADAVVEIIDRTGTSGKVIHIVITSGNIAPYRWEYTYWNDGSNVSGWIAFQNQLTAGNNITISGTTISATDTTYSEATSSVLGLVRLGSDTQSSQAIETPSSVSGRQYPVQVDSQGKTSVNIPWTDTIYDNQNPLNSDYVNDSNQSHKFVTDVMYEYLDNAVYQHPEVNSLTIYDNSNNPIASSYESGSTLVVSKVSHKETNISNISGNLTLKYRPNILSEIVISNNISPSSTDTDEAVNRSLALVGDISFILSGTDTKGTAFEKISVISVYTYAYTAITDSIIIPTTGLTRQSKLNDFSTDGASISYSAGDYIYFYVQTSGKKIYQYAAGQWIEVAGSSLGSVTITKSNGATAMYYAYKFGPMSDAGTDIFRVS